jgi:hypothetical protein
MRKLFLFAFLILFSGVVDAQVVTIVPEDCYDKCRASLRVDCQVRQISQESCLAMIYNQCKKACSGPAVTKIPTKIEPFVDECIENCVVGLRRCDRGGPSPVCNDEFQNCAATCVVPESVCRQQCDEQFEKCHRSASPPEVCANYDTKCLVHCGLEPPCDGQCAKIRVGCRAAGWTPAKCEAKVGECLSACSVGQPEAVPAGVPSVLVESGRADSSIPAPGCPEFSCEAKCAESYYTCWNIGGGNECARIVVECLNNCKLIPSRAVVPEAKPVPLGFWARIAALFRSG